MSATLTWYNSGLATKTGTAASNLITDMVTLINSKSGDANFSWAVASSSTAGPLYIVLKRKNGTPGRILLVIWATAPAGNNAAILDQSPPTNNLFIAFFPNGNVDTPSNLTAASGTIMGDDTGAVKVQSMNVLTNTYTTSFQGFYFDSAEAAYFGFQNPASASCYFGGAGYLLVDSTDTEIAATFGAHNGVASNWGGTSTPLIPWSILPAPPAGGASACYRCNFGGTNRAYFAAWTPSGPWANQAVGANCILTDVSASKAYFVPNQLLGQNKNEGFLLKARQIAYGPGALGAFAFYQTTGPVVQARQFNAATAGGIGYPWLVNFKI